MRFGVVVFPGSNCDADCYHALKDVMGKDTEYIWHKAMNLDSFDCIVLPGGSSYGGYLRRGAIAKVSPVMERVVEFAKAGKPVIGISDGFHILTEAGLLPGAMLRNKSMKFICDNVHIRVENAGTPFTGSCSKGQVLKMPIAHGDGSYYVDSDTLKEMKKNNQVVFRYCNPGGEVTDAVNTNGSLQNIAGICNREGNVLGMMPHPERCVEEILGGRDGKVIFQSIINYLEGGMAGGK